VRAAPSEAVWLAAAEAGRCAERSLASGASGGTSGSGSPLPDAVLCAAPLAKARRMASGQAAACAMHRRLRTIGAYVGARCKCEEGTTTRVALVTSAWI